MDTSVKVSMYDNLNNATMISCKIIDDSTRISRSYTKEEFTLANSSKYLYWFYVPDKWHDVTETIFKEQEVIDWMISQKKKS